MVQITRPVLPPVNVLAPESQENTTSLGSGFVYDNNGHIVTNHHVIDTQPILLVRILLVI